ncbi:MAG TPA: ribosome maturation factor RimM [Methylophilaceae bacterium]
MSKALADMVVMGRIAVPYGVQGWVKIQTFTQELDSLLDYPDWYLGKSDAGKTDNWQEREVEAARMHSNSLIAKFAGCDDRNAAFALKGQEIAVPRGELPAAEDDEYYWSDLIGLQVYNLDSLHFGQVDGLLATGSNDVLVVKSEGAPQRLIPFTNDAIKEVDLAAGKLLVDWDPEF